MSENKSIVMPKIPATTPKDISAFATYLLKLDNVEDLACKTWEKIPGCYQINYKGRVLGAFYLSEKKGTYRILTTSKFFKTIPSNGKIIKNGLDLYVSNCDSIKAGIDFIRNTCRQFVDKANNKPVVQCEQDDFILPKAAAPEDKKAEVTEG